MEKDCLEFGTQIWDYKDVIGLLPEFMDVYAERPIKNNVGGMNSAHLFWTWYVIKSIRPRNIIESGVYRGQGTWFFRKTLPDVNLYCIDPKPEARRYTDEKATYFTQDFSQIDWDGVLDGAEKETLCFFDDHQDAYSRLQQMRWMGFCQAMFEDNYPVSQGDCYSIKKALSGQGLSVEGKTIIPPNDAHIRYLENNIETYTTFPPLVKTSRTRWGDLWGETTYPTADQILSRDIIEKYPVIEEEATGYTWICYVKLKE